MKSTLFAIFALFCLSANAKEYTCKTRNYRLTVDLEGDKSTHIWVRNLNDFSMLYQGYAGSIDRGQRVTSFYFYGQREPLILSFRNQDIQEQGKKIKAHIEATLENFYFRDYMNCSRR